MKHFSTLFLLLLCCLVSISPGLAQSGRVKDATANPSSDETSKAAEAKRREARDAAQLYEEADAYAQKKFDDFEKRHMPFHPRLADTIKQERRRLTGRPAPVLAPPR